MLFWKNRRFDFQLTYRTGRGGYTMGKGRKKVVYNDAFWAGIFLLPSLIRAGDIHNLSAV